jgi:hypothetical protein
MLIKRRILATAKNQTLVIQLLASLFTNKLSWLISEHEDIAENNIALGKLPQHLLNV